MKRKLSLSFVLVLIGGFSTFQTNAQWGAGDPLGIAQLAVKPTVVAFSGTVKAIISGLPFASLPKEVQRGVVDGTHEVLAESGEFRTFQYVHAYKLKAAQRFRAMMKERFDGFARSTPVLRNVPPAYVLTYRKAADQSAT